MKLILLFAFFIGFTQDTLARLIPTQNINSSRKSWREHKISELEKDANYFLSDSRSYPPISISIPSGYGLNFMDFFVNGGLTTKGKSNNHGLDATSVFGLGLSNLENIFTFETYVTILDLYGDFAQDGAIGFSASRKLPWYGSSLAVGIFDLLSWGNNFAVPSYYLAYSNYFKLNSGSRFFRSATLSVGFGNGVFAGASHQNFLAGQQGSSFSLGKHDFTKWGLFAGASLNIISWLNLIADWNGQGLDLGLTVAPFSKHSLYLSLFMRNIYAKEASSELLYGFSFSYSANFLDIF